MNLHGLAEEVAENVRGERRHGENGLVHGAVRNSLHNGVEKGDVLGQFVFPVTFGAGNDDVEEEILRSEDDGEMVRCDVAAFGEESEPGDAVGADGDSHLVVFGLFCFIVVADVPPQEHGVVGDEFGEEGDDALEGAEAGRERDRHGAEGRSEEV